MKYYNTKKNNYNKKEIFVNFIVIRELISRYRYCRKIFLFNNNLYRYIKIDCEKLSIYLVILKKNSFIDVTKNSTTISKLLVNVLLINTKFIIFRLIVNFLSNIDINYKFKNWNYTKVKVFLLVNAISKNIYLNNDIDVLLTNRTFFKTQTLNTSIKIITFSLKVRDLNINRYKI